MSLPVQYIPFPLQQTIHKCVETVHAMLVVPRRLRGNQTVPGIPAPQNVESDEAPQNLEVDQVPQNLEADQIQPAHRW